MKPIVLNINILGEEGRALRDMLGGLLGPDNGFHRDAEGAQSSGLSPEFDGLGADELHFMRVFIMCEGKIKEVEKALGVSYPTVKSKLASLKDKISQQARSAEANAAVTEQSDSNHSSEGESAKVQPQATSVAILEDLKNGKIEYSEALKQLKDIKGES